MLQKTIQSNGDAGLHWQEQRRAGEEKSAKEVLELQADMKEQLGLLRSASAADHELRAEKARLDRQNAALSAANQELNANLTKLQVMPCIKSCWRADTSRDVPLCTTVLRHHAPTGSVCDLAGQSEESPSAIPQGHQGLTEQCRTASVQQHAS
jgi:hypothetical protein